MINWEIVTPEQSLFFRQPWFTNAVISHYREELSFRGSCHCSDTLQPELQANCAD